MLSQLSITPDPLDQRQDSHKTFSRLENEYLISLEEKKMSIKLDTGRKRTKFEYRRGGLFFQVSKLLFLFRPNLI